MATLFAAGAASGATAGAVTAASTAAAGTSIATTATLTGTTVAGLSATAVGANILTGLSALSMVRQGQAAKVSSRVQADRIKTDATNREVNRRRRLVSSLASQNATRAASGIASFEGSSKDIMLEDLRTGRGSLLVERAGAGTAAQSVLAAGDFAQTTGMIRGGASLLDQVDRSRMRG